MNGGRFGHLWELPPLPGVQHFVGPEVAGHPVVVVEERGGVVLARDLLSWWGGYEWFVCRWADEGWLLEYYSYADTEALARQQFDAEIVRRTHLVRVLGRST
jgi:hypothetical protein